jgi:hypothetical protein
MEPKLLPPQRQQSADHEEPAGPSACPVCGSPTVPMRGMLRCTLCCFVLCEGCDGLGAQG